MLPDRDVLIVDCQATGADPRTAHLLEVGWGVTRAGGRGARGVVAHLIKLPEGATIPRPVVRLTGIAPHQSAAGISPVDAYRQLLDTADYLVRATGRQTIPTVIHFARYEAKFLKHLHQSFLPGRRFPFDIICTHEIARRLLPALPRRGLRAVAGFFGHSVSPLKRCRAHVSATAAIWRHVVYLLARDEGLRTLDDLKMWLQRTPRRSSSVRCYPLPREVRRDLPDAPGIYRMLRSNGDLLYIGKAKSLKKRVNSYFRKNARHSEHILEMLSQAAGLAVKPTETALEAALLESEAIKRHAPPYNKALQEAGRRLFFCSKDFREFLETPGENCPVGPIAGIEAFAAVHDIGRRLRHEAVPVRFRGLGNVAILGIPDPYAPELACYQDGIDVFHGRYAEELAHGTIWRNLMRIGTAYWKNTRSIGTLDTDPADGISADSIPAEEDSTPFDWTPEAVADGIEALVSRCAQLIRRSRWFCMLSEASLDWREINGEHHRRNVLVLKSGRICRHGRSETDGLPPIPPGNRLRWRERQRRFDLQTYDRLRVLTTELRRLVAEVRDVRIRLSARAVLNQKQIQRLLNWV
jgi:DNA polymerase-3 subunit epsilon